MQQQAGRAFLALCQAPNFILSRRIIFRRFTSDDAASTSHLYTSDSPDYEAGSFIVREGYMHPKDIVPPQFAGVQAIDTLLAKESITDPWLRENSRLDHLTVAIPNHEIEEDLPKIFAMPRNMWCKRLGEHCRKNGHVPANLMALPSTELRPEKFTTHTPKPLPFKRNVSVPLLMLHGDVMSMINRFGFHGVQAVVTRLVITHPEDRDNVLGEVRALPCLLERSAATQAVQHIQFRYLPKEDVVTVDVPVKLINEELCKGVKKKGWLFINRRTLRYKAYGAYVPSVIEVDVRGLDLDGIIHVSKIPVPYGAKLMEHWDDPVVVCTTES